MQNQPNIWFVQVETVAYGPYTHAQMQAFTAEGRINARSIISQSQSGGYNYAQSFEAFASWSAGAAQPVETVLRPVVNPVAQGVLARDIHHDTYQAYQQPNPQPQQPAPQSTAPAPVPQYVQPAQSNEHKKSVFIIMAEIRSENGMTFLHALQNSGVVQRIGDSVWLLKAYSNVQILRNQLSQMLTGDDRLFIQDSYANETAWFNIGTEMDRHIRSLWDLEQ